MATKSEVKMDRRHDTDRRQQEEPIAAERRKVQRRRQIDPTTCERDYSGDEIEFMQALDDYKRDSGRMFPTCSEILEVIRSLGYHRLDDSQRQQLGLKLAAISLGGGKAADEESDEDDNGCDD